MSRVKSGVADNHALRHLFVAPIAKARREHRTAHVYLRDRVRGVACVPERTLEIAYLKTNT